MLKPMKPKKNALNPIYIWGLVALLILAGIIALVTAFSRNDNGAGKVEAAYTNAAETVAAQQLTLQASSPTETQVLFTQTPLATFTPFASPTLFATQAGIVIQPTIPGSGSVSGAVGCYNSVYVSDVTFPDNAAVTAGQVFTKTWKLQNNGTCPWTPTFKAVFVSGNAMGGVPAPIGITVAPGASADISINMTAPAASGSVTGYWILVNDSAQQFGTSFYALVNVGGVSTPGTVIAGTVTAGTVTATGPLPAPANNPVITLKCTPNGAQYEYTGTLTWEDKSNNEDGFNIYVGGVKADIAPMNTNSYQVKLNGRVTNVLYDAGTVITYSVEAFNGSGAAVLATVTGQCP